MGGRKGVLKAELQPAEVDPCLKKKEALPAKLKGVTKKLAGFQRIFLRRIWHEKCQYFRTWQ